MLRAEEFGLKKWIEHNVTDYTAMQYLCHVYSTMQELAVKHIQLHAEEEDEATEAKESDFKESKMAFCPVDHAIDLIKRYPSHEALWYYLRVGYTAARVPDQEIDVLKKLGGPEGVYAEHFERWRKHWDSSQVPTVT
jgi:protein prenyltransferase alpha subunit repeat containing protein 1